MKISWFALGAALTVGLCLGRALPPAAVNAAAPPSGMSAMERLFAEQQIRQQIALYGLLADGDGLDRNDLRQLADRLLTPDAVMEIYPVTGPVQETRGREAIAAPPPRPAGGPSTVAGRHFMVATYFDEITPTEARTRTTALHLDITKNLIGPECKKSGEDACGGRVVKGTTWVYHTIWAKTAEGWQMKINRLRNDE